MNTQDNISTTKIKPVQVIGFVLALIIIVFAILLQTKAGSINASKIKFVPVTTADHIRGEINAPVQIIEYSDLECGFCKNFHQTMTQIFAEYGTTGQILWVYRHFPLVQLHKKAVPEAIATECVAKLAGKDAFWKIIDKIFQITPSNDGLDLSTLPALALEAGVKDIAAFNTCYKKQETISIVQEHLRSGAEAGVKGTPYSIVISPAGNTFTINGAYDYTEVKKIIEQALADK